MDDARRTSSVRALMLEPARLRWPPVTVLSLPVRGTRGRGDASPPGLYSRRLRGVRWFMKCGSCVELGLLEPLPSVGRAVYRTGSLAGAEQTSFGRPRSGRRPGPRRHTRGVRSRSLRRARSKPSPGRRRGATFTIPRCRGGGGSVQAARPLHSCDALERVGLPVEPLRWLPPRPCIQVRQERADAAWDGLISWNWT